MKTEYVQGEAYFTRTNNVPIQLPYLTEDIETDVIIAGGGITGNIIGYYFSKENINTVILEKGRIAYGSTSITTSLLQYELDSNLRELEQYTTIENAITSYKLGLKALDEIDKFINQHGNRCDYEKKDTLLYTSKNLEIKELEEEYRLRKENGFDVKLITENDNPFSLDLKAGVYGINSGAQLDPYKFTHHLLDVSKNNGLRAYENTEIVEVRYSESGVEAITNYGNKVRGKILIVATGFNTKLFSNREFGKKTTTYNIVTYPVKMLNGWENKVLIRDNEDPYNYLRVTSDNRIIIGGEDISFIPGIFDEEAAKKKYDILEQRLKAMFPKIDDIKVEFKYCGAFASTDDNLGFLGKDPKNQKLWYGLGYGANGILFATLGGMMLSQLFLGKFDKNLELFKIDRFNN